VGNDVHMNQMLRQKQQSRDIVKEVLKFGVDEYQKLDIIYLISLSLESNAIMKDITDTLKKHRETINNEEDESNLIETKNKILTS
jgi:hypothetical protein